MADINDYKIIGKKSAKYFELLCKEVDFDASSLPVKEVERLGFYLFIIDQLTYLNEVLDIARIVSDTRFNDVLSGNRHDDCGIDAVVVDDENNHLQLFNFKYRNTFKVGKQGLNETILSAKFINALINDDLSSLEGKTKRGAESILDKLNSSEEWQLTLYVVSNEDIEVRNNDHHLKQMEKLYGLKVVAIGLDQICQFVSLRPSPINAELVVENDAIMSFSESSISSSKSYILRLPLSEIVRITCSDKTLRSNYNIEDLKSLTTVGIDYSILFDNVRGLVTRSKYNKNISHSLKNSPSKFFMFNNGLTLTANDIRAVSINANKRVKLSLDSIQVLNGGQSLRTIHQFNSEDAKHLEDYLSKSEVLVRIFKTSRNSDLNNKIAEYTNSQNSISNVDLKSLRSEQLQIEQYLDEYGIVYSRKTGDTGLSDHKTYRHKISMERFGQILMALDGKPEKATNQKKAIFDQYYDGLFLGDRFPLETYPCMIDNYFKIKKEYAKLKDRIESSEQKVFYILYLQDRFANLSSEKPLGHLIELLEKIIQEFEPDPNKTTSEARKLIQVKFKRYLDDVIFPEPVAAS